MVNRRVKILLILVAILLLVVLLCILITMLYQQSVIEKQKQMLVVEIQELMQKYDQMQNDKEYLQSWAYAEQRARELGLIKKGEELWVLVSDERKEALLAEIQELLQKYDEMKNDVEFLQSWADVERQAKLFGLIKDGETLWVLQNNNK